MTTPVAALVSALRAELYDEGDPPVWYSGLADRLLAALTEAGYRLVPVTEIERAKRIETAARYLDHAYGPIPAGGFSELTPLRVKAWADLQYAIEGALATPGATEEEPR